MPANLPEHPSRPESGWTAELLAAELRWQGWADEPYLIIQERRLTALEESLCSRRARRRLRRQIRESVRLFRWAGRFTAARIEAVSNQMLTYYD